MFNRNRKLRKHPLFRTWMAEQYLRAEDFVMPYFVVSGKHKKEPIENLPLIYRFSKDMLLKDIEKMIKMGMKSILLFGVESNKTLDGKNAYADNSLICETIRVIKEAFGKALIVLSDVCLCPYTSHGHCGVIKNGAIDNDRSIDILAKMALSHVRAGVDMVAPSDMMDGRVMAIRNTLDKAGYAEAPILSYAIKYASSYYGPFRVAAQSAPSFGDRSTYQMDYRNVREAIKEALSDQAEGADMIMVKPAMVYGDILQTIKQKTLLPLATYNVSGEYSMVKLACQKGIFDEKSVVMENMYAFKRAGADVVFTYHLPDILKNGWLS